MRILYLNHNVIWRSTFYRCLSFARELVRRGHDATLLTIDASARVGFTSHTIDGVEVVTTPDLTWGTARSGWDPWNTAARIWFLRRRGFDLVHAFDGRPTVIVPALWYRRRFGVPLVMDWADWWGRGGIIAERESFFLRYLFAPIETFFEEAFRTSADAVTVISDALAQRSYELGVPRSRIHRLPGGVQPDVWQPRSREEARRRLQLPQERALVLFSGFVHYDIELVLRSFELIRLKRPDALLVLTGKSSDRVQSLAASFNVSHAVEDRGTVPADDVPWYIAAADVCLAPFADRLANRGRWPNKVGDYLAMARPVVSNPVGEVRHTLGGTGAALLSEPSPQAMAGDVLRVLSDPELAQELGRRGRELAETQLAYSRHVEPLVRLYERLTATS